MAERVFFLEQCQSEAFFRLRARFVTPHFTAECASKAKRPKRRENFKRISVRQEIRFLAALRKISRLEHRGKGSVHKFGLDIESGAKVQSFVYGPA